MADTETAVTEAEETTTEVAAESTAADALDDAAEDAAEDAATGLEDTAVDSVDAEEEARDTLGAEIALMLDEDGEYDTKSVKSETKSTKSFKSFKGSIAGSLRRFSMGSKLSGLNWKSSQFSLNTRKTDDYMDPVQRRARKTIGKVVVREEHTEWIKEEVLTDVRDAKTQLASLTYFTEDHPEFPGQPFSNMMDLIWIEMQLMADYIDGINARIERLGYSPTPEPTPSPERFPTPNFVQNFFCWHRYVPSDSEGEEDEKEEPETVEPEKVESIQTEPQQDESLPKSPGCCK